MAVDARKRAVAHRGETHRVVDTDSRGRNRPAVAGPPVLPRSSRKRAPAAPEDRRRLAAPPDSRRPVAAPPRRSNAPGSRNARAVAADSTQAVVVVAAGHTAAAAADKAQEH